MAMIELDFRSQALGYHEEAVVILPDGPAGAKFPVLWLFHGANQDCTEWMRQSSIERYASKRGLAVVMPTVSNGHGMDNIIESPGDPKNITLACDIAATCATINLAANYLPGTTCTLDLWQLRALKQLRIHTSIQSPYMFQRAMTYLPRVDVEKLVTAIRPLDELNEAFAQQRDHEEFKIVIKPWDDDPETWK